ncbi:hypothetical protein AB4Z32_19015 [Massilia sp. 2TAF26]|uniref:hypothetical protein n=1 Tax=Massilia sp. 2TAF26 TaxID=3233012 RepID=UPI003F976EF3
MKVLLLGEYSSLHNNLKDGLVSLGHEVTLVAGADGFKKIPRDVDLDSPLPSILGSVHRRAKLFRAISKIKNFDVVQLINPFILYQKFFPGLHCIKKIAAENRKLFMSASGDDAYLWRFGKAALRYSPFDDILKYDLEAESFYMQEDAAFRFNEAALKMVRGIIPIMYEYEVSYAGAENRLPTIPIPLNLEKIQYRENRCEGKIVVFHGLNRYGAKGTRHVEEAFGFLAKKYPNDLELIIDGKMPLDRYLKLMERTNVVIDQTNTYSLGVNGVYALAMGKVVLGGAEPESLTSIGVRSSPVINISPNAASIVLEIEKLLERRSEIPQIGFESRKFAEEVHSHVKVASTYCDIWNKN